MLSTAKPDELYEAGELYEEKDDYRIAHAFFLASALKNQYNEAFFKLAEISFFGYYTSAPKYSIASNLFITAAISGNKKAQHIIRMSQSNLDWIPYAESQLSNKHSLFWRKQKSNNPAPLFINTGDSKAEPTTSTVIHVLSDLSINSSNSNNNKGDHKSNETNVNQTPPGFFRKTNGNGGNNNAGNSHAPMEGDTRNDMSNTSEHDVSNFFEPGYFAK